MLFICYFFTTLRQAFAKHNHPIPAAGAAAAFPIPDGWRGGMDVARRVGQRWGRGGTEPGWHRDGESPRQGSGDRAD